MNADHVVPLVKISSMLSWRESEKKLTSMALAGCVTATLLFMIDI